MSTEWDDAVATWERTEAPDDLKTTVLAESLFACIEAVRHENQTLRFELNTALLRIKALEESVEDLLHGEAGETDVTVRSEEPEIRVRISHAHTLKERWRCDSTTVEWTGRGGVDWARIGAELALASSTGRAEADARNDRERIDQEAKAA